MRAGGSLKSISDTILGVKIGTPKAFRNLTLFPILGGKRGSAGYLTLDQALAQKSAHITEVTDAGSVPELKFVNEAKLPVFLLDGEELIGAKQNRVLNLSILVPAGKTLVIPVSCVERGRWRHRSQEFASAPHAHFAEGRAKRMSHVTDSMKVSGQRHSDQGMVWMDIDQKISKLAASSDTSAMSDIFERHTAALEDYVRAFAPEKGQTGIMFGIDGRVTGFDLFDCPTTLRKLYPKLLRSYALDALSTSMAAKKETKAADAASAARFMDRVRRAKLESFPAIGEGEDVRLSARWLTGAALAKQERVVHLSAFRLSTGSGRTAKPHREMDPHVY